MDLRHVQALPPPMKPETLGVALTRCYFCGESDRIVLNTWLSVPMADRVKECHGKVLDLDPCTKCQGYMKQGVILMTFDPAKSSPGWNKERMPNPWRTGGFFVVRDAAIKRMITPKSMADWALKHRWMWVEHEAAEKMGLFEQAGTENSNRTKR